MKLEPSHVVITSDAKQAKNTRVRMLMTTAEAESRLYNDPFTRFTHSLFKTIITNVMEK